MRRASWNDLATYFARSWSSGSHYSVRCCSALPKLSGSVVTSSLTDPATFKRYFPDERSLQRLHGLYHRARIEALSTGRWPVVQGGHQPARSSDDATAVPSIDNVLFKPIQTTLGMTAAGTLALVRLICSVDVAFLSEYFGGVLCARPRPHTYVLFGVGWYAR